MVSGGKDPGDKVCTIVGAGPGVSLGVARAFGKAGYALALVSRSGDKVTRIVKDLCGEGLRASGFVADAGDENSIRNVFGQIAANAGPVEVLVYNAFGFHAGPPSSLRIDDVMADFAVNVAGALACVQAVLPGMKSRSAGTILLTGGGLALEPAAPVASLAIGKAGMRSLTFSLFQELRPWGIHAATVTICGPVQDGTHFSPDLIAREFLALHRQEEPSWQAEHIYK